MIVFSRAVRVFARFLLILPLIVLANIVLVLVYFCINPYAYFIGANGLDVVEKK